MLRSLSVAFWGDGRLSESFLSEVFFLINVLGQRRQIASNLVPDASNRPPHLIC